MNRVLVTGAAGFIGSHMVDRLLVDGCEVVGLDAFTGNYSHRSKERNLAGAMQDAGFRLVEGDLLTEDLDELLLGVDGIAHLAGEPGVRRSWGDNFSRYLERNVLATQRLLEAADRSAVTSFVYASSSSVYGSDRGGPVAEDDAREPASPYGLSKLAAEDLVGVYARERSLPATVLRYFTVYGPRQRPEMALSRFIFAATHGRPVEIFGDGQQVRDLTYVSDVVNATVMALTGRPGGIYNVGGGARVTVNEMLEAVRRVTGGTVPVTYGPAARGDVASTWADATRAARDLGYLPAMTLDEGVADQAAWAAVERPIADLV